MRCVPPWSGALGFCNAVENGITIGAVQRGKNAFARRSRSARSEDPWDGRGTLRCVSCLPPPVCLGALDFTETGGMHALLADRRSAVAQLILDHLLRAARRVKRVRNQFSSRAPIWPSIQPCASAPSMASGLVTLGRVRALLRQFEPSARAPGGLRASHFSHARRDRNCTVGRSSLATASIVVGADRLCLVAEVHC